MSDASTAGAPSFDATELQWLEFFDKGGRHDIPYNIQYLVDSTRTANSLDLVGISPASAAVEIGLNTVQAGIAYAYFGGQTNPVIGVSREGLHLPTIPVVRWADLAAVLVDNLREVWLRASNAFMIADPQHGGAIMTTGAQINLLVVNGPELQATINTPNCENAVVVYPTASGAQWGAVLMQLDPGLGAEQVVQLMYLINLMCEKHGVTIYHTGGLTGAFASLSLKNQILGMN
jgi:hypothetical protein